MMLLEMRNDLEPTTDGTKQTAAEVQPDPAGEREVPYYFEEFTLSGGCCGDGLAPKC